MQFTVEPEQNATKIGYELDPAHLKNVKEPPAPLPLPSGRKFVSFHSFSKLYASFFRQI